MKGKKVLVFGMARSGIAAARLLLLRGAEVYVCDAKREADFEGALDDLKAAGAVLCGSALRAASLNVFINTKSMKNRDEADALNERADRLLAEYLPLADRIFEQVTGKLRPERA